MLSVVLLFCPSFSHQSIFLSDLFMSPSIDLCLCLQRFILMRDPDVLFTILESDIPASNGIIHIIDKPFTLAHIESSNNNMEVKPFNLFHKQLI